MSYQVDSRPGGTFCRLQTSYSIENLQGPFGAAEVKEHVFTVKCVNSTSKGILLYPFASRVKCLEEFVELQSINFQQFQSTIIMRLRLRHHHIYQLQATADE